MRYTLEAALELRAAAVDAMRQIQADIALNPNAKTKRPEIEARLRKAISKFR